MAEARRTTDTRRTTDGWGTTAGLLCLAASLLLSSTGVRTVRAEDGGHASMSVDPKLEARLETSPPVPPPPTQTPPPPVELQPGEPGVETLPGVIVLNTRGYNYGPPIGELDPAALDHEAPPARERP